MFGQSIVSPGLHISDSILPLELYYCILTHMRKALWPHVEINLPTQLSHPSLPPLQEGTQYIFPTRYLGFNPQVAGTLHCTSTHTHCCYIKGYYSLGPSDMAEKRFYEHS